MKEDQIPGVIRLPPLAMLSRYVAARLSSRALFIRHSDRTMRTQGQHCAGVSAWNLSAGRGSLRGLPGPSDAHARVSRNTRIASVFPTNPRRPGAMAEWPRLSPTQIYRMHGRQSASDAQLWRVLRSEEHRRGALWETAGFLAIW